MPTSRGPSLWSDTFPEHERVSGSTLDGDLDVDVAIVGAGLTGLWTALHLLQRDRRLRVALLERETIGFGASGRNGGWCSALLPMELPGIANRHGAAAATRMLRAMQTTVADVVAFAAQRDPAIAHLGGTISLARSEPHAARLRQALDIKRRFGFGEQDYRWLDADDARRECAASSTIGGVFTPHCAAVHPLRLVHAVADAVQSAGGVIYEHAPVVQIGSGRATTPNATVRAPVIVRATEGYTRDLPGQRRTLLPIYSLMIATDPLPDETWAEIGLADRPTFHDARHLIIYGQRTADGRLAFGGRGAAYHFGSVVRPEFDTDEHVRNMLIASLRELFPVIADVATTHHWGGVLGAARDWHCSVRFDRASGLAAAGGYVGDGVSTTHLAGRTLASLITDSDDDADRELVRLPWVGHRSRRWEPEPLRWIGVNAARGFAGRADDFEARTGRPSRLWGGLIERLLGH
jgi:glycine/D-amino acid oxidase-like deaminating enzyme